MKKTTLALALISSVVLNAQTKKEKDITSIKSMCGCYEVTFNFAETFNYSKDKDYQPSAVKHDKALEWAQLVEGSNDDKIQIQHLLIVGSAEKPHIIKHWRQDWLYENTDFYQFNGDNEWKFERKSPSEVKGQWTQKVYQVDDSPRYEGTATWVHVDGKNYWENTTDAPLPRREYTKRSDYNVTQRGNRHEILKNGWVHDQDNAKIIRKKGEEDFILAEEKGYNTYVKVDDAKCKAAQDWWKDNQTKWKLVRNNWDAIFSKKSDLHLKSKVDDKHLFMHLFPLEKDVKNKTLKKIIYQFVK